MIKDILCVAAVGIGSAMVGWSIGASKKCPGCIYKDEEFVLGPSIEVEDIPKMNGMSPVDEYIMTQQQYAKEYETYKNAVQEYNLTETVHRDTPDIYIISYNTWCETDEDEYDKDTLVWYTEDEVLVDNRDSTIKDYAELVGENALDQFGIQSHDADVVYIRNEQMKMDFELIRKEGSYRVEVLGLSEEAEEKADAAVREALEYFNAREIEDIDPAALAKYHNEREDE